EGDPAFGHGLAAPVAPTGGVEVEEAPRAVVLGAVAPAELEDVQAPSEAFLAALHQILRRPAFGRLLLRDRDLHHAVVAPATTQGARAEAEVDVPAPVRLVKRDREEDERGLEAPVRPGEERRLLLVEARLGDRLRDGGVARLTLFGGLARL